MKGRPLGGGDADVAKYAASFATGLDEGPPARGRRLHLGPDRHVRVGEASMKGRPLGGGDHGGGSSCGPG